MSGDAERAARYLARELDALAAVTVEDGMVVVRLTAEGAGTLSGLVANGWA